MVDYTSYTAVSLSQIMIALFLTQFSVAPISKNEFPRLKVSEADNVKSPQNAARNLKMMRIDTISYKLNAYLDWCVRSQLQIQEFFVRF